jgi:hypothetical protein
MLTLSDDAMDVLRQLAAPVVQSQRDAFMSAVTAALASCPESGPGVVYRVARRTFALEAQRETELPPRRFELPRRV